MKKYLHFLLLVLLSVSAQATTRRVLFIGNSYIYTNDMPLIFKNLAASFGDTLIYDQSTPGGYTLQQHSTDATTISKIFSQPWDIVIIQEQSQRPAFDPAQVDVDTRPYARVLDSLVRANDSCTQRMFLMTWGYKNGDATNCAGYPPICTYGGMQQRLRESYILMAQDNEALVAPVGAAWNMVRDSFPTINLYNPDESHPLVTGSYLESCVLYASIFHKTPYGSTYINTLSTTDAQKLQRIAARITMDSLGYWQQYGHYPYASFTRSVAGNTVTFTGHSLAATSYHWSFGDAQSATTASAVHTYAASGVYTVTLTASDTCFAESKTDTVHIGNVGVSNIEQNQLPITIVNEGEGSMRFLLPAGAAGRAVIYNTNGQKVKAVQLDGIDQFTATLSPGIYMLCLFNEKNNTNIISTNKFIVP